MEKSRKIKVLGHEVDENSLKASLKGVLTKRGLNAHLIIEDEAELKKFIQQGGGSSAYANVYKYAFF
jgi:hypothetical protein